MTVRRPFGDWTAPRWLSLTFWFLVGAVVYALVDPGWWAIFVLGLIVTATISWIRQNRDGPAEPRGADDEARSGPRPS